MKKYIKYLMGMLFFVGLCASGVGGSKTYATNINLDKDPDVFPPTGSVSVENAAYTNGVYYISFRDVKLNITASDNRTETANLKMSVQPRKLTEAEIMDEENWEPYAATKDWYLEADNDGLNHVYLYLKDEAGNVSNSLLISNMGTYTVTYTGQGTHLPEPKSTSLRPYL